MALVNRLVLDVLKPHQPNVVEFAQAITAASSDCRVRVTVLEVDESTETIRLEVLGPDIDFSNIQSIITDLGGSLHSIDEVEVGAEDTD